MAVGLRIKFDGGTQGQYEAIHSRMRIDENPPEGMIFHSAGPIDGGWGVIDFWESRERVRPVHGVDVGTGSTRARRPDLHKSARHQRSSRFTTSAGRSWLA